MTLMVDGVLGLVVLEMVALAALKRARLLPNVAAGAMLLVAMRLALAGTALGWVGLTLLAAGLAHGFDLKSRV